MVRASDSKGKSRCILRSVRSSIKAGADGIKYGSEQRAEALNIKVQRIAKLPASLHRS
jgi:hypothetical protein